MSLEGHEQSLKGTEQKQLLEGRSTEVLVRVHTPQNMGISVLVQSQWLERAMGNEKQIDALMQETGVLQLK